MSTVPKDPKLITPPNFLKQKVGSGGLPEEVLNKAQHIIEQSGDDFAPYAKRFIEFIKKIMDETKGSEFRTHDHVTTMIYPVMQLKAHGGMFGQPLISEISSSALNFLENIHVLDDDAIDVLKAHYDALQPVTENKVYGLGGKAGALLIKELNSVCDRYYKKHDIKPE